MADVMDIIRAAAALRAAKYRYTAASEAHATREAHLLLVGYDHAADRHHAADLAACRALIAEEENPDPKPVTSECGICVDDCDRCDLCA